MHRDKILNGERLTTTPDLSFSDKGMLSNKYSIVDIDKDTDLAKFNFINDKKYLIIVNNYTALSDKTKDLICFIAYHIINIKVLGKKKSDDLDLSILFIKDIPQKDSICKNLVSVWFPQ